MDPSYGIFTKNGCIWCQKAVELLNDTNTPYETWNCISWDDVDVALAEKRLRTPLAKTFPLILKNDAKHGWTIIGGYDLLTDAIDEPILAENPHRFTLFPIQYPDLYEYYQKALAAFWTPSEISLADDIDDWAKLSDDERYFIKHVLAFFAGSDGIVMENLAARFSTEVTVPEARQFYASQLLMEAVHSELYSLLIDALAAPDEARVLFQAIETMAPVRKKAAWAQKFLDPTKRFAERLVAFICVEGLLFSGSFCAIYWLKRRAVLPGLALANEFISRDEALHYSFGIQLYSHLKHPLSFEAVRAIVEEAVETELDFVIDAIPVRLIGMNADMMCDYIKFVADRAMTDLGYAKIYNKANPFPWMELIGLTGKSNFFERLESNYARAGVMANASEQVFGTDGDF